MRIHIQNPPDASALDITQQQWQAAVRRHPVLQTLTASFGRTDAEFDQWMTDAEVLLTWASTVKRRYLDGTIPVVAPRLKMIHCNSAGIDRLLPFDWLPNGVRLVNNSGTQSDKVGEFAIMALLMLQNNMPALMLAQSQRTWTQLFGTLLEGRVLCIVGVGALGSGVAHKAKAFGMRVIGVRNGTRPHPDFDKIVSVDQLDEILPTVDDLLLACPLTDATRNLLSRDRIALMRRGARALNFSRGLVWDQEAVCDALELGHLESAFTDVTFPEPLPPEHRMWRTTNLVLTPHISADDRDRYNDRTLDLLAVNLAALNESRPLPNAVDLQRGY